MNFNCGGSVISSATLYIYIFFFCKCTFLFIYTYLLQVQISVSIFLCFSNFLSLNDAVLSIVTEIVQHIHVLVNQLLNLKKDWWLFKLVDSPLLQSIKRACFVSKLGSAKIVSLSPDILILPRHHTYRRGQYKCKGMQKSCRVSSS